MSRARIVFFPGLGCDARLVEANRDVRLPIDVRPWLQPLDGESIADYARRTSREIDVATPIYLAGVSLGAMIAQEVARHVPCRGVISIAGCRSHRGVPRLYSLVARAASRAPRVLMIPGKRVIPRVRILFGIRRPTEVALFERMLGDADERFIRWSLDAIQDWPGVGRPRVPTLAIHGTVDHVLPIGLAGPIDRAIVGAGHVVNVTHAREVNATINAWLDERGVVIESTRRPSRLSGNRSRGFTPG